MNKFSALLALTVAMTLCLTASAATVTLSDVHICCPSCVKVIAKTTTNIAGLTAVADAEAGTIVLTADDAATLQKGADALVAVGFFGKSSDPAIKINAETGAKDQKMQSMTIEHLHLCCGHCVKDVNEVLKDVPGVTTNTAAKGAKSFQVMGDFNDKAVFDALQKAGLTGMEK